MVDVTNAILHNFQSVVTPDHTSVCLYLRPPDQIRNDQLLLTNFLSNYYLNPTFVFDFILIICHKSNILDINIGCCLINLWLHCSVSSMLRRGLWPIYVLVIMWREHYVIYIGFRSELVSHTNCAPWCMRLCMVLRRSTSETCWPRWLNCLVARTFVLLRLDYTTCHAHEQNLGPERSQLPDRQHGMLCH